MGSNGAARENGGESQDLAGQTLTKKEHPSKKDGFFALHDGEAGCGAGHRAATSQHGKAHDGSLDVCIRVEIDQHDAEGKTQGYGLTVPLLEYSAPTDSSSSPGSRSSSSRSSRPH